jgi:hypothetical protein
MTKPAPKPPRAPTRAMGPQVPAPYDLPEATAFQAIQRGEATPDQQRRALDWLIKSAAGVYEFQYYPSDRDTAFALGRAFVGQQVVKLLTLNLMSLRRERNATSPSPAPQA